MRTGLVVAAPQRAGHLTTTFLESRDGGMRVADTAVLHYS